MKDYHNSIDIVIPHYNNYTALSGLSHRIESWVNTHPFVNAIIVDDGSSGQNFELPASIATQSRVTLIRHSENRGRAAARNTGIRAGESAWVVFLDVDCSPENGWLDRFLLGAESGANCIFSNLRSTGTSYWSRYLNEAYAKKAKAYSEGGQDFITQFCMIHRDLLDRVGGFNEEYVRYGFEDRDLIQKLISSEKFAPLFLEDVYAEHSPPESIKSIVAKAKESGQFSSHIFSRRFPVAYRSLGYWFFDAREHSSFYCISLSLIWKLIDNDRFAFHTLIDKESFPYFIWKPLVKISSALAYFQGTYCSKKVCLR